MVMQDATKKLLSELVRAGDTHIYIASNHDQRFTHSRGLVVIEKKVEYLK